MTFAEMARVLAPGGYGCIVAPGAGQIHRFPYDCWRFYPDGWIGLCAMAGLELVESYFESDETAGVIEGGKWRDCAVIVRKPVLEGEAHAAYHARLDALVEPYRSMSFTLDDPRFETGPCFTEYNQVAPERAKSAGIGMRLRLAIKKLKHTNLHTGGNYRGS